MFSRELFFSATLINKALNNKATECRLNAAVQYYIFFGGEINYLDDKKQIKIYSPDKYATMEREKIIKSESDEQSLKMFMLFSSGLILLIGIIVTILYLRQRRAYSHR
ncbi:MAG: hypothetical protein K4571_06405 [Deltaproteobacteria bacterium]